MIDLLLPVDERGAKVNLFFRGQLEEASLPSAIHLCPQESFSYKEYGLTSRVRTRPPS